MIGRLWCLFGSHRLIFERRDLYGVPVPHWVCKRRCGFAVPTLRRVPSEHRRAYEDGQVKPLRRAK